MRQIPPPIPPAVPNEQDYQEYQEFLAFRALKAQSTIEHGNANFAPEQPTQATSGMMLIAHAFENPLIMWGLAFPAFVVLVLVLTKLGVFS